MSVPFWLAYGLFGAAVLHITEEFFWPGGFRDWYRRYRPEIRQSITLTFLVLVNLGFLVICWDAGALAQTAKGAALWLTIAGIAAGNGAWHAWACYRSHSYSPGTVTGVLLYLPLAAYGAFVFLSTGRASVATTVIALALGGSYMLWSRLFHRWRTRSAAGAR